MPAEPVSASHKRQHAWLVAIPVGFAILGLLLRYWGYAQVTPGATWLQFSDGLCRWDCIWYTGIAEHGYDPFPTPELIAAGNWAFFPFYPVLVGLIHALTGWPVMAIATPLSIGLSILAARLAWPLLEHDWRAYTLFSAFLLAGPFSFYFTTFYTETAFVLLTIGVFRALRSQRYLLAGFISALLSATRIVGVFIVFAIVLEAFADHRRKGGSVAGFVPAVLKRPDLLLSIFVAPTGLFAYMAFLHWRIGDALAFSHVQRAWARATGNPFAYLWRALTNVPPEGFLPSVSQWLAVAWIVGMGLIGVLLVRRKWPEASFAVVCVGLPIFAGMASMLRFVVGLAPVMIEAMLLLARSRWVFVVSLLLFLAGAFFFTQGWMTGVLTLV